MDNYDMVREIVLGGSVTWRGSNSRFWPSPGTRVMDVGANLGVFSALCACKGAEVTAYEADVKTYTLLSKMIQNSGAQINAVNAAVLSYTGEANFLGHESHGHQDQFNGSVTMDGVNWTADDAARAKPVACISFADAIGDLEWDCIKMDIEGSEADVLLSTSPDVLRRIKFMYLELHPWTSLADYVKLNAKLQEIYKFEGAYWSDVLQRWEAVYLTRK